MRRILLLILLFVAFSATPIGAVAQSAPDAGPTIKTEARQVLVDVVVTDNSENPVGGLPKASFHVSESGMPQEITFFQEHTGASPGVQKAVSLPPHVYSNFPMGPVSDSINVLLVDTLNTPIANQSNLHSQLISYLKKLQPGTRIAIFTLASRLRMVQGFTADPSALIAVLNGKKGLPRDSALLEAGADSDQITETISESSMTTASALSSLQQFAADQQSFQTDIRVRTTLDAFQKLGAYLYGIPGRKNVIWLSGSFPLSIDPDATLQSPFSALRSYTDEIKKMTGLMTAGRIAIYPVDVRGVMTQPMFDISQNGNKYSRAGGVAAFAKDAGKFTESQATEHATMSMIADETGGKAIFNTNDIQNAVDSTLRSGSHYYTLAYAPAIHPPDGSYRKLTVKVDPGNYHLAYRRGYYADDSKRADSNGVDPSTNSPPAVDTTYLRRGAPDATEILFKARAIAAAPQPDTSDPSQRIGDKGATLKGPVVRYTIDWATLLQSFQMNTTPDGLHHGTVRFLVGAYDADGQLLNAATQDMHLELNDDRYNSVIRSGVHLHEEIDLPKGEVFLRLAVVDPASGKAGALEIPLLVRPKAALASTH